MRLFSVIVIADFIVFMTGSLLFTNPLVGLNSAIGVTVGISAGAVWAKWVATDR